MFFGILVVFEGLEGCGLLVVLNLLVSATEGVSVPLRFSCERLC
jgi:hypothetical protein